LVWGAARDSQRLLGTAFCWHCRKSSVHAIATTPTGFSCLLERCVVAYPYLHTKQCVRGTDAIGPRGIVEEYGVRKKIYVPLLISESSVGGQSVEAYGVIYAWLRIDLDAFLPAARKGRTNASRGFT
jgi:hypothetical protein